MKYIFYLLLVCSIVPLAAVAQIRHEVDVQEWPTGVVTLTTGEVLNGAITYYRAQDIITVTSEDGQVQSLSPVNVEQFEVQNRFGSRSHLFKTVYWDLGKSHTDFKKPTFFEQLVVGNTTLLMREKYYKRNIDTYLAELKEGAVHDPMGYPIEATFADQIRPQYFVVQPDGTIIGLNNARKDFLSYCGKKATNIKSFVRKQKLNFDQPLDFIAIVTYYNTLL